MIVNNSPFPSTVSSKQVSIYDVMLNIFAPLFSGKIESSSLFNEFNSCNTSAGQIPSIS